MKIKNIKNIAKQFPLLKMKIGKKRIVYLDSAATSQKPQSVIDAVKNFYETYNAPAHRGVYDISEKTTEAAENVRELVKEIISARFANEIIFTSSATHGINAVVNGVAKSLKDSDCVLLTELEHHSMVVPWLEIKKRAHIEIAYSPVMKDGKIDLKKYERLLVDKKPKFVGISHASNVLGIINPVEKMTALAHKVGATVLIDASQSVAHLPIDVQKIGCDALVFSSHKMYGPDGVGVLYGTRDFLNKLPPFFCGGHMISKVTKDGVEYSDLPAKHEAGTLPVSSIIGLGETIFFINSYGFKNIQKHNKEIAEYTLRALLKVPNIQLLGSSSSKNRLPIFSFAISSTHPHDIAFLLGKEGIAVRAGHHCAQIIHSVFEVSSSVRASCGIYTTKKDIDALVNGLIKVVKKLGQV